MKSRRLCLCIHAGGVPGSGMGSVVPIVLGRCLFQIVSAGVGILSELTNRRQSNEENDYRKSQ